MAAALLTFIFSLTGAFPQSWVEAWYSRFLFPKISLLFGWAADSVLFCWLDILVLATVVATLASLRQRRFGRLGAAAAVAYLVFFWGWGLNYHRTPLAVRLNVRPESVTAADISGFAARAADEINRLYGERAPTPAEDLSSKDAMREQVALRVRHVVGRLDGREWQAASRVKRSLIANPWFRVAGIDGLFNPIGHEPIVNSSLLDIERPFIIAHELAHVRGYPVEGDANLIAVLATVLSSDPALQYSGWLHLWFYLRTSALDGLLDDGPRQDLLRIIDRARTDQIRWVSNVQSAILDWFLKANKVEEGVRSYSQILLLAAGTQDIWNDFR